MKRKTRTTSIVTKTLNATHGKKLPGVIIDGIEYDTAAEAAADWNVGEMAIYHWMNGQVQSGIYYPPFENCRPKFANTAHHRAWQLMVASKKAEHRAPPGFPPAVVIEGFIYPSVYHAAVEFDVTPTTIRTWCRNDSLSNCWYTHKKEYAKVA